MTEQLCIEEAGCGYYANKCKHGQTADEEILKISRQLCWLCTFIRPLRMCVRPSGHEQRHKGRLCPSGGTGLTPVEMTMALDVENKQPDLTDAQEHREI